MKVLIPLQSDDPEMVPAVMPMARELAQLLPGAELHLLTVLDPKEAHLILAGPIFEAASEVTTMAGPGGPVIRTPLPRTVETNTEAQDRLHREVVEALQAFAAKELPGTPVRCDAAWGPDAAEAIVEAAARLGVNMILMATHGRTGLSHFIAGSVAEAVIRKAKVPVLVAGPGCHA